MSFQLHRVRVDIDLWIFNTQSQLGISPCYTNPKSTDKARFDPRLNCRLTTEI